MEQDPLLAKLDEGLEEIMAAAERQPRTSLVVQFSVQAMENPEKTKDAGRPIFDDVEMIEVRIPGDIDRRVRPVRPEDKETYAKQYLDFKRKKDQTISSGTPLAEWPIMKRSQVEEGRYLGIFTVEQLSDVSDVNLQRLGPGWMALRQKARDWLTAAKDGAALNQLREQLDVANHRIAVMEEMLKKQATELQGKPSDAPVVVVKDPEVEALKAAVAMLMEKDKPAPKTETPIITSPKKRGRPSKAELAARAATNGEPR